MNPALAQKFAMEIGSLVVQCHTLQSELDQAQAYIKVLEAERPMSRHAEPELKPE